MPSPRQNESRGDFIKCCVPIVVEEKKSEGKSNVNAQNQAVGKCEGLYNSWLKRQ